MKIAAFIVTLVSLVFYPLVFFYYDASYLAAIEKTMTLTQAEYISYWRLTSIAFGVVYAITSAVSILTLVFLTRGGSRKSQVTLGIFMLLFGSVPAGILLLVMPEAMFKAKGLKPVIEVPTINRVETTYVENEEREIVDENQPYKPSLKDYEGNQYIEENDDGNETI